MQQQFAKISKNINNRRENRKRQKNQNSSTVWRRRASLLAFVEMRSIQQSSFFPEKNNNFQKSKPNNCGRYKKKRKKIKIHKLFLKLFFGRIFFFHFASFIIPIFFETFALKNYQINKHQNRNNRDNFSYIIDDLFIIVNEKVTDQIHAGSPNNRANRIVHPKIFGVHPARTRNKRNKCAQCSMEFPQYDIPKTIFFDLSFHNFLLCNANSDIIAIICNNFGAVFLAKKISKIIPKHRTY